MKKIIYFILIGFLIIVLLKLNNNDQKLIKITENEILFNNHLLDTQKTLPRLFIQPPLELNKNAKYSYLIFNDLDSGTEFIRIDKKIIQYGTSWFDNVTVFYTYNSQTNGYRRVLVSSEEQNNARFPKTEIISQTSFPLTIKFYYDISKPHQCDGPACRSYWTDFYRWDNKKKEFKLINQEYQSFYQDLKQQYEEIDKKGCDLGDNENTGLKTFSEIYEYNKTNHCKNSTREELNKFIQVKNKIIELSLCNNITDKQAINIIKHLPEVTKYLNLSPTNDSESVIDVNTSRLKDSFWTVHVYSIEKDTTTGVHTATFNWYSVDKCKGDIKCSFSEYDNNGEFIKVSDKYPCNKMQ